MKNCSVLIVGQFYIELKCLIKQGYQVTNCEDELSALKTLQDSQFDFIFVNNNLQKLTVLEFIKSAKQIATNSILLIMAKRFTEEECLSGIEAGAYDYLMIPNDFEALPSYLKKIFKREKLTEATTVPFQFNFVAKSPAMLKLVEQAKKLAKFNTTVLLQGESGSGKEVIARAIHNNSSRKDAPFIALNCAAIPENLLESELFGYKRGAFTDAVRDKVGLFEEANGGTIFLDEIAEMPLMLQSKILRVLQERQIQAVGDTQFKIIDVRVIAATLCNLEEQVQAGRFREDLFYRLNVISLELPPLRERPEDIEALAYYFLKLHSKKLSLKVKYIASDVIEALKAYSWKGNVRELENCIEHALVLVDGNKLTQDVLPEKIRLGKNVLGHGSYNSSYNSGSLSIKQCTAELEKELIVRALKKTSGNRTQAAKILELSHRALLYKLKEYNIN